MKNRKIGDKQGRGFVVGLPYTLGNYVYIVKCGNYYKIGITQRIASRMTDFRVNNPYDVELIFYGNCDWYKSVEIKIHKLMSEFHHKGEWFLLGKEQVETVINIIRKNGAT